MLGLFRGQGQLAPELIAELDASGIPYAFNTKAWADEQACLAHLRYFWEQVKQHAPEYPEHMLLLDGLGGQSTTQFIEFALDLRIYPVYFPPNCTHLVQPVDHRVAAWLKAALARLYVVEESVMGDAWARYRANDSMSLQYKRTTALNWVDFCWRELKRKESFLLMSFLSTGRLITLKGEHKIKFPDIDNYAFVYPELVS